MVLTSVLQSLNLLLVLAIIAVAVYFLMISIRVLRKMDKALDIWLEQNNTHSLKPQQKNQE